MQELTALRLWPRERWLAAVIGGVAIAVLVSLPTAVIPTPIFGRAIEVTWWSYPVVVLTGILGGLLLATYVRPMKAVVEQTTDDLDRPSKLGMAGTLLAFFAVGCPVCNKLVLIALGTSGAMSAFAPVQPFLALGSLVLMAVALRLRLRGELACLVTAS
jgi:hypothetical protein